MNGTGVEIRHTRSNTIYIYSYVSDDPDTQCRHYSFPWLEMCVYG